MKRWGQPALIAIAWFALVPQVRAADSDPGARVARVERWVNAVLQHTPGDGDTPVLDIAAWSNQDLQTFRIDATVLLRLMRDPRLSSFQTPVKEALDCLPCIARGADATQARQIERPQTIRYTDWQLHRLKVLGCAAAGTLTSPECAGLKAANEIDAGLRRLADQAAASRDRGDGNYLVKRGALFEADVAMLTASSLRPLDSGGPRDADPVRVHLEDGQQTAIGFGEIHWDLGRLLLDNVRPQPDRMVKVWYRATATWMLRDGQYNTRHLAHGLEMFPGDADLAFLSGSQGEVYASAAIQAFLKSAALPIGVTLEIGAQQAELRSAETMFRRATKLNPNLTEARVRLGHVLLARGRPRDAADELHAADVAHAEPLLQYFDAMFLGAAEEALGRIDEARDSYARASSLYPTAQSPHLASSALEGGRGDRAQSLAAIARVFDLPIATADRDDPWWTYFMSSGRAAGDLLAQLRQPFLESPR
jgi:tetratricopeptide (TPR) repeat protein